MIHLIEQDLFDVEVEALFHCANCQCRMKSGVAAGMVKFYPEAIQADLNTIPGDYKKLGNYSYARGKNGRHIYNLYGQYYYGTQQRQLNYEAIYTALDYALKDCQLKGIKKIALPYKLGCGLAGGDWNIVNSIIESVFKNYNGDVYVCKKD